MDIAISGSTGLIGTALDKALRERGDRVARLVRSTSGSSDEIGWDPKTGSLDAESLEGIDAIVHLAGEPIAARRWTADQKRTILDSRVTSTSLLATTVAEMNAPPKALISGSAIGYYGDRGPVFVTERDNAGSGFLAEVCLAWEETAARAATTRTRVCFARSGIVLDPHGGALAQQLPLFRLGIGGRIADGQQYWSWISLVDEVGALCWLLDNDISGPVNLTAPSPVTNQEFTDALGKRLRRPTRLPTPSVGLYARLGRELARELLFTSCRALPAVLEESGFEFRHRVLADAFEDILSDDVAR